MQRYQFLVGVSLTALEEELNRVVADDPDIVLREFTYVSGTGFIAAVERVDRHDSKEKPKVGKAEELSDKKAKRPQRPRKTSPKAG